MSCHGAFRFKGKASVIATNGTFIGFISKVLSCHGTCVSLYFAHFCNRLTISSAGVADTDRYVADLHEPNAALISFTAASSGKSPGLLLKDEVNFCANA